MNHRPQMSLPSLLLLTTLFWGCGKEGASVTGDENTDKSEKIRLSPAPCMATFTQSYTAKDVFGDEEFSIRSGETFIVQNIGDFLGTHLYYEFPKGAYDFEVKKTAGGETPFTSSCIQGKTQTHLAVFSTTTVYADSTLTQPLCTLSKGTTAPTVGSTGFYLVGDFFSNVYHVELGGFASECRGASGGYLRAPEVTVFGATTNLIPINTYQTSAD